MSRYLKIVFILLLIALTAKKYVHIFLVNTPYMIDYIKFYSAAHAIVMGQDPFDIKNLVYTNSKLVPFIFPGMTLPFIPIVGLGLTLGGYVFMLLNMCINPLMLYYLGKKLDLSFNFRVFNPNTETLVTFIAFYAFLNCNPTLSALQAGQLGILVCLFLILSLYSRSASQAAFNLAIATAFKFSLVAPVAITFFVKQHFKVCFLTAGMFLLLAISPAFFGLSLSDLYTRYVNGFTSYVFKGGFDSFQHHGYMLVNFDFFKVAWMNTLGKGIAVGLLLITFYREMKKPQVDLKWLLLLSCVTLMLSYHRSYDLTFSMLLMIVLAVYCFNTGKKWHCAILSSFVLFITIPDHLLRLFFSWMGHGIGENSWAYLTAWTPADIGASSYVLGRTDIIPFHALYNTLLTGYVFFIYFFTPEWLTITLKTKSLDERKKVFD